MTPSLTGVREATWPQLVPGLLGPLSSIGSIEAACQGLVRGFYEHFSGETALVRVFHSFEFGALPQALQASAVAGNGGVAPEDTRRYLALLGTYGDQPEWCARGRSTGHQAIPLTRESIQTIPMLSRLFQQIGFDIGILLGEADGAITTEGVERCFGVFHVEKALGSPHIPAQDFVRANGVRSVMGTGVMLPQGDISVFLCFGKTLIAKEVAAAASPLMAVFWRTLMPLTEQEVPFFEE